jgi:hypothetical protein
MTEQGMRADKEDEQRLEEGGVAKDVIHHNGEEFISQSKKSILRMQDDTIDFLRGKIREFEGALAVDPVNNDCRLLQDELRKGLVSLQSQLIVLLESRAI